MRFLLCFLTLAACSEALRAAALETARRPNILLIFADDQS
jgi:hypothetical protein